MRMVRFGFVFLLLAGTALAQTFTGTLDGYYSGNFNNNTHRKNGYRAFDTTNNEFSLNYAELAVERKAEKGKPVGYRVDIGFGDAAKIVNAAEPSTAAFYEHIQQAYVTASHEKLTVDFGKFVTPLGAEVIETKDNWNYSRSFLFTYAVPFYHFGVRAMVNPNDKVSFGVTATNGWNNVKENNDSKTVGFHLVAKPGKLTWAANYMVGNEVGSVRHTFDTTATVDITKKFAIMGNYDYLKYNSFGDAHLNGIALYAKIVAAPKFIISPRWELLQDEQGFATGTNQKLKEFTVTTQFPLDDEFSLYGEYRHDYSDAKIFRTTNSNGLPNFDSKQDTLTVGVVFKFMK